MGSRDGNLSLREGWAVPDSLLVSVLTGSGVAGVFCVLFVLGIIFPKAVVADLKQEKAELMLELEAQRDRADTAIAALSTSRDVIAALREGLVLGRAAWLHDPRDTAARPPPHDLPGTGRLA